MMKVRPTQKKMKESLKSITIDNREVVIKGIGKMYYESGFPISMAVSELKKLDVDVSVLHVADELLKNGWMPKTVISRLSEDFEDDLNGGKLDIKQLSKFCNSTYEEQREMIFDTIGRKVYEQQYQ